MNPPRTPTPIQAAEGERENGGMQASPRTHCYRPAVTPTPASQFPPGFRRSICRSPPNSEALFGKSTPSLYASTSPMPRAPYRAIPSRDVKRGTEYHVGNLRNDLGHVIVKVPSASRKPVRQVLVIYPLAVLIIAELGNFFT